MSGPAKVPDYTAIADRLRVEPETAAQDCRNALQVLHGARDKVSWMPAGAVVDGDWLERLATDLAAIEARLWSAVRKLEAK